MLFFLGNGPGQFYTDKGQHQEYKDKDAPQQQPGFPARRRCTILA
jgi:hypothetical protein